MDKNEIKQKILSLDKERQKCWDELREIELNESAAKLEKIAGKALKYSCDKYFVPAAEKGIYVEVNFDDNWPSDDITFSTKKLEHYLASQVEVVEISEIEERINSTLPKGVELSFKFPKPDPHNP